jgi:hypothetical protein
MNVLGSRHGIYGLGQEFLRYRPTVDYAFTPQGLAVSIGLVVGMLGLFLVVTTLMLRGQALVPVKDPRLNESLGFENA